ncbi:MAG: NAD-dependent epimerase/dehydratase family protein [Acidobacteriota bacterium]
MAEPVYLLIGGAGYFGARLAEDLARRGRVVITGRRCSTVRNRWLARHAERITWRPYDAAEMSRLPSDTDYAAVFNLATPSAAEAAAQPEVARQQALATVERALDLVRTGRARRLIHFSTFHVYGTPSPTAPRRYYGEDDPPTPTHPYGLIHAACESRLAAAQPSSVLVVRPTNLVGQPAHTDLGPQQRLIFLDLCRQAVTQGTLTLLTDGLAYRDFLPISAALAAIHRLLEAPFWPRQCHLAAGCAMPLRALAERIQQVAVRQYHREVTLTTGKQTDAFQVPFQVDTTTLHRLGWASPEEAVLDAEIAATLAFFQTTLE